MFKGTCRILGKPRITSAFSKKKQEVRKLRYEAILRLETRYPVGLLCGIAGVSRSAYSKWKQKPLKKSSDMDDIIKDIFAKSGRRFGYRKIKMRLKSEYGLTVNHKRIRRIMAEYGLRSIVRPKYRKPIMEVELIKPNILNRDFSASKPAEKLVTDITYIPTPNKMMYLSVIIDLFDNYPVAWNLSDCQEKSLSIDTVKMLVSKVDLTGSILHSDRGIHYTNKDFTAMLARYGIKQSMSRKGNCWDNACAESFFSQLKSECIYLNKKRIKRESDVYDVTAEYFDFYINRRPQQRLGGLTPCEYRRAFENS